MTIEIERFIDLSKNDLWTSADIDNRARNLLTGVVSQERQDELRTIMIGHITQMRLATQAELQEVFKVKNYSEAIGLQIIQARLDNQLLINILDHEKQLQRLSEPEKSIANGFTEEEVLKDIQERDYASSIIFNATPDILEWVEKRKPVPVVIEENTQPPYNIFAPEPVVVLDVPVTSPEPVTEPTDTPVVPPEAPTEPPVDPVVPTEPAPITE